jgi:hypothetical protein
MGARLQVSGQFFAARRATAEVLGELLASFFPGISR